MLGEMRALAITILVSASLAGMVLPACAGAVSIVAVEREVFEIDFHGSTVDDVLSEIGERFGFTVERISPESTSKLLSGRFVGNADQIVTRVLRDQGHVVIRASDAPVGIKRILLVGASHPVVIPPLQTCPPEPVGSDPTNPVTLGKPSPSGSFGNCTNTR
jgi:hypothetical protein